MDKNNKKSDSWLPNNFYERDKFENVNFNIKQCGHLVLYCIKCVPLINPTNCKIINMKVINQFLLGHRIGNISKNKEL